jgi:hypothetical protein
MVALNDVAEFDGEVKVAAAVVAAVIERDVADDSRCPTID